MLSLDPDTYRDIVRRALEEDVRDGDITTDATVAPTLMAPGVLLMKAAGVAAGVEFEFGACRHVDPGVRCAAGCRSGGPTLWGWSRLRRRGGGVSSIAWCFRALNTAADFGGGLGSTLLVTAL